MNIVFAGTPPFAEAALAALVDAGHRIRLVLTQPDRGAGRGRHTRPSAVKRFATEHAFPLLQPASLRDSAAVSAIAEPSPDVMVVTAYGLLIPREVLAVPVHGCINIHASLLPRWRGAAPIQRALIAGDRETGITIMQMDEGLDTGPILRQGAIRIAPDDTAQTLHDRLAALGARLIVETLAAPRAPRPQPATGVTYANKIAREEARIRWTERAEQIERKIRAFDPEPGAFTSCRGESLKIWRARVASAAAPVPGSVLHADGAGIVVACGEGALRITELQRAGGRRLPAKAYLAGHALQRGTILS
jgi:methionyl-tRNA formyltransferase